MAATEGSRHFLSHVNAAFCAMNGKEATALLGRPIADILPPSAASDIISMLDGVYLGAESGSITRSSQSYTAWAIPHTEEPENGMVIQVSASSFDDLADKDNQEANDLMRAINARLLIASIKQQELAQSAAHGEKRLREVINGLNAIVCEVDASTGRVSFVNQLAHSFLGYTAAQWNEPVFWKRLIHPDDYEKTMMNFDLAKLEGGDYQFDFRVTTADGTSIWLRNIIRALRDVVGTVIKLRCVIVDVTQQKESLELISKALDRERRIADALQYSVLGEKPEEFYPGLSVATIYEPAMEEALVGGDFFDTVSLPNGDVMLVVGDVTGKGLKAAARTVEAKYALRAFAQDYAGPAENTTRLNNYICRQHPYVSGQSSQFIALAVAIVNPHNGMFQAISAGSEPPFIVRASGDVEEMGISGLILGVEPGFNYTEDDQALNAGDILVMTTDGITEVRSNGVFFGCGGIAQVVRLADASTSLQDIGKLIVAAARKFGNGEFKDDVCLLLARPN
jgi:PAS domain S-box-containing protein